MNLKKTGNGIVILQRGFYSFEMAKDFFKNEKKKFY